MEYQLSFDAERQVTSMDDLWRKYLRICEKKLPGVKHYYVTDLGFNKHVDYLGILCLLAPAVEEQIQPQIQEFL